jgi:hypothetical protein
VTPEHTNTPPAAETPDCGEESTNNTPIEKETGVDVTSQKQKIATRPTHKKIETYVIHNQLR